MTSAWAFAVAAWRRPGVEAICLELQDDHGQSPALLLWRAWTLEENRGAGREILAKAVQIARAWEDDVVGDLRALRRRLAKPSAALAEAGREAVRRRVLEAELEAEHALLDALAALAAPTVGEGRITRIDALVDLAQAWRPPAPVAALGRLCEALWDPL